MLKDILPPVGTAFILHHSSFCIHHFVWLGWVVERAAFCTTITTSTGASGSAGAGAVAGWIARARWVVGICVCRTFCSRGDSDRVLANFPEAAHWSLERAAASCSCLSAMRPAAWRVGLPGPTSTSTGRVAGPGDGGCAAAGDPP